MPTPLALWPKSESKYLLGCNIAIVGAFVLYGEYDVEEVLVVSWERGRLMVCSI